MSDLKYIKKQLSNTLTGLSNYDIADNNRKIDANNSGSGNGGDAGYQALNSGDWGSLVKDLVMTAAKASAMNAAVPGSGTAWYAKEVYNVYKRNDKNKNVRMETGANHEGFIGSGGGLSNVDVANFNFSRAMENSANASKTGENGEQTKAAYGMLDAYKGVVGQGLQIKDENRVDAKGNKGLKDSMAEVEDARNQAINFNNKQNNMSSWQKFVSKASSFGGAIASAGMSNPKVRQNLNTLGSQYVGGTLNSISGIAKEVGDFGNTYKSDANNLMQLMKGKQSGKDFVKNTSNNVRDRTAKVVKVGGQVIDTAINAIPVVGAVKNLAIGNMITNTSDAVASKIDTDRDNDINNLHDRNFSEGVMKYTDIGGKDTNIFRDAYYDRQYGEGNWDKNTKHIHQGTEILGDVLSASQLGGEVGSVKNLTLQNPTESLAKNFVPGLSNIQTIAAGNYLEGGLNLAKETAGMLETAGMSNETKALNRNPFQKSLGIGDVIGASITYNKEKEKQSKRENIMPEISIGSPKLNFSVNTNTDRRDITGYNNYGIDDHSITLTPEQQDNYYSVGSGKVDPNNRQVKDFISAEKQVPIRKDAVNDDLVKNYENSEKGWWDKTKLVGKAILVEGMDNMTGNVVSKTINNIKDEFNTMLENNRKGVGIVNETRAKENLVSVLTDTAETFNPIYKTGNAGMKLAATGAEAANQEGGLLNITENQLSDVINNGLVTVQGIETMSDIKTKYNDKKRLTEESKKDGSGGTDYMSFTWRDGTLQTSKTGVGITDIRYTPKINVKTRNNQTINSSGSLNNIALKESKVNSDVPVVSLTPDLKLQTKADLSTPFVLSNNTGLNVNDEQKVWELPIAPQYTGEGSNSDEIVEYVPFLNRKGSANLNSPNRSSSQMGRTNWSQKYTRSYNKYGF